MNKHATVLVAIILLTTLTACGSQTSTTQNTGEVSAETLELGRVVFQANCSSCHYATKDAILVGPSLVGIADRAGTRVKGLDAYEYIRQSVLDPEAFLNEDFPNVMPQTYESTLSEENLEAVIQYLLHLE